MDLLLILKKYWNKYKSQIIMGGIIIILGLFLFRSMTNGLQSKHIYENNMKALTEQVEIWKTKAGNVVAEKTVLEGDYKLLKQTNEDLYEQIKALKVRPKEVVYVETEIVNEIHDTTYVVEPDTNKFTKKFDFSNDYRILTGTIEYNKPNLGLSIDKDIVLADFTVAIKDSKVYVTSTNPFIQYNDIQGVVLPKTKPKFSIGVGPSITAGYDLINKKPGVTAGVSVSAIYNLVSFGKKTK
jgi:hypothetical protein